MSETAADLVDRVLPRVPVRQWVLTVPWELRFRLARDSRLLSGALRIFVAQVFRYYRRRSGVRPVRNALCGGVTGVQRFGGALNLNVHFHTLALDGVYVREAESGSLKFRRVAAPAKGELEEVLGRTVERISGYLERQGCAITRRGTEVRAEEYDPSATDPSVYDVVQAASVREWIGLSSDPRKVPYVGSPERAKGWVSPKDKRNAAAQEGFTLHAGVRIRAGDREGLEKVCRYVLRPPFSGERLERLSDGRVLYGFRRPRADGTSHVVLTGVQLVEKLAALVAPPRSHLVRYHGILGPHARSRGRVVREEEPEDRGSCRKRKGRDRDEEGRGRGERRRRKRKDWATVMRRTLGLDVLSCPECSGRMRVISTIERPELAAKILRGMGLPDEGPEVLPSRLRPPPQGEFDFVQSG